MGGGILPVAIKNNKLYFLFSREAKIINYIYKDAGKWSDFGGSNENNENRFQTAVREGWEESNGFLGDKKHIEYLIKNNTLKKITINKYTTYVILIDYDDTLPKRFRDNFLKKLENDKKYVLEENGYFEKDMLKWIRADKLKSYVNKKTFFRRFYHKVVNKVINIFTK